MNKHFNLLYFILLLSPTLLAQPKVDLANLAEQIEPKVIEWRRHFHQFPELSNREFKTSEIVAKHLTSLGMEVRTGIAHTGVAGILKGGKPGPVVALRADMDGLPVTERVDLPFASKEKTTYLAMSASCMPAATIPIPLF
ncbi:MAG: hypothetical protein R2788_03755 [Saprospiraceae bacterium]